MAATQISRMRGPPSTGFGYTKSRCCGCKPCWRALTVTMPAIANTGIATATWRKRLARRTYRLGRGDAMTPGIQGGPPRCLETDHICDKPHRLPEPPDCPGRAVSELHLRSSSLTWVPKHFESVPRREYIPRRQWCPRRPYPHQHAVPEHSNPENIFPCPTGLFVTEPGSYPPARWPGPGFPAWPLPCRRRDRAVPCSRRRRARPQGVRGPSPRFR